MNHHKEERGVRKDIRRLEIDLAKNVVGWEPERSVALTAGHHHQLTTGSRRKCAYLIPRRRWTAAATRRSGAAMVIAANGAY